MKRIIFAFLCVLLLTPLKMRGEEPDSVATENAGQRIERKSTPVENEDYKSPKPLLHYYDRHGNPLAEPVLVLLDTDTVSTPGAKAVYPRLTSVSFGFNFMDAVMKIAGQKFSSYDFHASLSLYNWIFPTVEAGIGMAKKTPYTRKFTYEGHPSFYIRAGLDYNFLYKSNPDYNAFIGLRAGFSAFRYSIDNISISSGYWDQTDYLSIRDQKSLCLYGQALAGIRVKIYKSFSMGWSIRYNFRLYTKNGTSSSPWFIPGYGAVNTPVSATFSLIYTLPFKKEF